MHNGVHHPKGQASLLDTWSESRAARPGRSVGWVAAAGKILVMMKTNSLSNWNLLVPALLWSATVSAQSALDGFDTQVNGPVEAVAVQADGKIIIGGGFPVVNGTNRAHIARLNVDGTVDSAFDPGANSSVRALVVQADGKIVVGGLFSTLGGTNRNGLGRLHPDGTPDQIG